jgi:hypothetical protein
MIFKFYPGFHQNPIAGWAKFVKQGKGKLREGRRKGEKE